MHHPISENRMEELWNIVRNGESTPSNLSAEEFSIYNQYKLIHTNLATFWESAPSSVVQQAYQLMPETSRTFVLAKFIRPTMTMGLARGAVSQVQFEAEDVKIRAQVEQLPQGWRIWGRTNVTGWTLWSGHLSQPCNDQGEFDLIVTSDSLIPLSLQNESTVILLPVNQDETGNGDN